jgi:microcystin-dependent protein
MSEAYLGEIRMFAGNFEPYGWAFCDGRSLLIAQNTALFSILQFTYGGDGQTTFKLPDLRGCAPMHWGDGPNLTPRQIGVGGGETMVALSRPQNAEHGHALTASTATANQANPLDNVLAAAPIYAAGQSVTLAQNAVGPVGIGLPHNNMQPYLAVNFIIALQGVYPPKPPPSPSL